MTAPAAVPLGDQEAEMVRRGDAVGVVFSGEDEAVVFLPCSGEVILCSREEWQGIVNGGSAASGSLRATLEQLRAALA